jgi:hypothetical protein
MKRYMAAMMTVGLATALWGTPPAAAQQVSSFEQLQVLVKPGDTVTVTDMTGTTTKGKIESVTAESLRLSANDIVREFSQKDARLVQHRKSDSLKNGAIIGAVTGGGAAAVMVGVLCAAFGDCPVAGVVGYIGAFAAVGAGAGVGVDALITSRHTLYQSPGTAALNRFQVKPLISADKKGAAVSFSF